MAPAMRQAGIVKVEKKEGKQTTERKKERKERRKRVLFLQQSKRRAK